VTTRPILYLDVDGVLLGRGDPGDPAVVPARHAESFLAFCTKRYDCRWLTTHCREGDTGAVMRHLARYAGEDLLAPARGVGPTTWRTLKTEVIDPDSDFLVIDDGLLQVEQEWLARHGILDRWIRADTRKDPDDLIRVLDLLRARTSL